MISGFFLRVRVTLLNNLNNVLRLHSTAFRLLSLNNFTYSNLYVFIFAGAFLPTFINQNKRLHCITTFVVYTNTHTLLFFYYIVWENHATKTTHLMHITCFYPTYCSLLTIDLQLPATYRNQRDMLPNLSEFATLSYLLK